jgi:uncharacterized protein (DUF1810 family)
MRVIAGPRIGLARAYLDHPVLGARLRECVSALQDLTEGTARVVFGDVDAVKLRSSLTLFHEAGGGELIERAIDRWCAGQPDAATLSILNGPDDRCAHLILDLGR